MLGGSTNSAEPISPEMRTQSPQFGYAVPSEAYPTDGSYPSGGGVLGALGSPSQRPPWWMQALPPPPRAAIGLRGSWPAGRFGLGGGGPITPAPDKLVEIPNPHIEQFIPQSTWDIWNAATILPRIMRDRLVGDARSNVAAEQRNGGPVPERLPEPPANRPGSQPPWIVGPAIPQKARRQEDLLDAGAQAPEQPDPNHRELRTVSPDSEEAGSTSDMSDPSLIGWRKRKKKAVRRVFPGGRSSQRTGSSAGAGNNGTGGKGPGG